MFINKVLDNLEDEKTIEQFNIKYDMRGDPEFIKHINNNLLGQTINTKQELIDYVKKLYKELTGVEMGTVDYALCRKFVKGNGMSDGLITDVVLRPDGFIDRLAKFYGLA